MKKLIFLASLVFFISMNAKAQSNDTVNKHQELVYSLVEKMPEFPGGFETLQLYFRKMCSSDSISKKKYPKGEVYVNCIIRKDGSIDEVQIARSDNSKMNEIVVNAVKNMPKWTPGEIGGQPVNTRMMIPVKYY